MCSCADLTDRAQSLKVSTLDQKNRRLGLAVLVLVLSMVALSFASVPLYRLFCSVTGIGGPAQIKTASMAATQILDRRVEVRFNADVDAQMPWDFRPTDRLVRLNIGQEGITSFIARNKSDQAVTGTAIFNVLPEKAGKYFHKTQCFCFGEQTLAAGAEAHMPVLFYIDPAFAQDPNMADVSSLTLSYTFYRAESPALGAALEKFQKGTAAGAEALIKQVQ